MITHTHLLLIPCKEYRDLPPGHIKVRAVERCIQDAEQEEVLQVENIPTLVLRYSQAPYARIYLQDTGVNFRYLHKSSEQLNLFK